MKPPCTEYCPNRKAECHSKCEKWLEYEKARNEEYKRRGKEKELCRVLYEMERDRKRDIALGKLTSKRSK